LKQAKRVLKEVERWSDTDVRNRHEMLANVHSLVGNAYLETGNYPRALDHHNKDYEIACKQLVC
jgi:tetratricopeptide repeat protein 25